MQPHQQPYQQTTSSSLRMDPLALLIEARRKLAASDELRNYGPRQGVGEGLDHHGSQQRLWSAMDVSTEPGSDTVERGATARDSTATSDRQRRPILARRDTQAVNSAGLGQLAELVREAQQAEAMRRPLASSGEFVMPQQRLQVQAHDNTEHSPDLRQKQTFDRKMSVIEEMELQRHLAARREQQELQIRGVQARGNEPLRRLEPQKDCVTRHELHQRFSTEVEHDLQLRLNEAHRELELQRRLSAQLESDLKRRFGSLRDQERQQLLLDQEADGEWDAPNHRLNARLEQEASQGAGGVSPSQEHHRRQLLQRREEEKHWPPGNSEWDAQQRMLAEYLELAKSHQPPSTLAAPDVEQRLDESVLAQRPRSVSRQHELKRLLALQRQTAPGNTRTFPVKQQHQGEAWQDHPLREALDSYTRTSDNTVTKQDILERELERLPRAGRRAAASRYSRDRSAEQKMLDIVTRDEAQRRTPSVSRSSSRHAQRNLLDHPASRSSERRAHEAEVSWHKRSASANRRSTRHQQQELQARSGDERASRHSGTHYGSRRNSNHLQNQQEAGGQTRQSRKLLEEEADMLREATEKQAKRRHRREAAMESRYMDRRATRKRSVEPEQHRYERRRRHGSRSKSGFLISSSNEQAQIRSLSGLSKQQQLERDHINDARLSVSSLKSTRNAMEVDADLTSSGDEDDEEHHRAPRESKATPVRGHPATRRPSQGMHDAAARLRQPVHPYESSDALGSSDSEASSDADTDRDRRRPKPGRGLAVGSEMAQSEASSMPDSSDEDTLREDAKPGREATEDRSAKRRPSDPYARRSSLEPKLPRSNGSDSQKRGSLRTNPGEPVNRARRQSRSRAGPQPPASDSDDDDDTLRAMDDKYPGTDSEDSDSEELDRRRQERIRRQESSVSRTARRDARRRSSGGKPSAADVGSRIQDTGDSSRTDADEVTALDPRRGPSWRSKHNRATADSTQESEQPEETRNTDSDRQSDGPPPPKPDTGSKVQLLDRTKLMQAAASKEAVDRPGGRHSGNSDKDREREKESDKDRGRDKGKEKDKEKDRDKEKDKEKEKDKDKEKAKDNDKDNNLSLIAKKALFKTVNRVPAAEHVPTQGKPEDTLTEEDIEACKTRAQKKNEERRKRKEPPQEEQQGQLAAPTTSEEQSEQMNSGPVDEEDDDVAPLLQKEAGRGEPAAAPPARVEEEPDDTDAQPVTGNTTREDKAPPPSSGDQGVMALEQERKKSVVIKRPKPPPPPPKPREEQQQLALQPTPPPPPQQQARAKPVPTEAARAPVEPPPPRQQQRRKSRPRKASAASIEPPPPPVVICCPCPPQPTSCCRRCGVACCYGGCCMRCRPC